MNALEILRQHAANNAWSNLRLHRACARLSKEQYEASRTSFFPSIPQTLNHILIVDWYYLDALEAGGKGRTVFEDEMPFADPGALSAAQRESDMRLVAFANRLKNEESLDGPVRLPRRDHVHQSRAMSRRMRATRHQPRAMGRRTRATKASTAFDG